MLFVAVAAILLIGPLRHWVGRHWALIASVAAGGLAGWIVGALLLARTGAPAPFLPLAGAVIGAVACGQSGPAWLRKMEKDGKE